MSPAIQLHENLCLVDLTQLDPHPDNPRVVFDEETVRGIVTQLYASGGEFPREHAGIARRVGDRYQVLSGHQRAEGARRAGLRSMWLWVVEADDAAARRILGLSNRQGELSKLEVGLWALSVEPAQGVRDEGIASLAAEMGIDPSNLSKYRMAAVVWKAVEGRCHDLIGSDVRSHALQFHAIHAAPREQWVALVKRCVSEGWSVRGAREAMRAHVQAPAVRRRATQGSHALVSLSPDKMALIQRALDTFEGMGASRAQVDEMGLRLVATEQQKQAAESAWVDTDETLARTSQELGEVKAALDRERNLRLSMEKRAKGVVPDVGTDVSRLFQAALGGTPTAAEALRMLALAYPERIVVLDSALESASKEAAGFLHVDRLMPLLKTLATAYYDAITGGRGDAAAYATLGWAYAARDGNHEEKAHTFHYDGRDIVAWRHLRIGTKPSPAETIRVYFEWDAETRRIVIGWCGGHLW